MTIFGYTWDEIKRAQQGGALARRIPAGPCKPLATEADWELLERYGEAELRSRCYFGVLDRLENTRLANGMPDCANYQQLAPKPHKREKMNQQELNNFLKRNKMTGNELAAKLGVHWVTVSRWRNGHEPIPKTVELAMKWIEGEGIQPDMTVLAPAIVLLSKDKRIDAIAGLRDKQEWQPIETAPLGKAVLVFYKNRFGKGRTIKAQYIEKHTEEASEEAVDIGFFDYCEEKDNYFTPQGWYEIIDNGHEYSSYELESGNNPTHWMPLPATPEQTSKEQLHIEFLRAELETVESVIATLSEENILGRMNFEGRKKKLEAELQQAEKEGE